MRPLFSRAHALHCLYAAQYGNENTPAVLWDTFADGLCDGADGDTSAPSKRELAFVEALIAGVQAHVEELDAFIAERAKGWRLERISRVDLIILRMAIYEILFCPNTPQGAVINEAVELCKLYGDEKAFRFVNGILGSIARDPALHPEPEIATDTEPIPVSESPIE